MNASRRSLLLAAAVGAALAALFLTLVANPHALGTRACHLGGRPYAALTLQQKAKLARCNVAHARGVIGWPHEPGRLVAVHRRILRRARTNIRRIEATLEARDPNLGCAAGACVETLIRRVWGTAGDEAIRVAECEDPGLYAHAYIDGGSVTGQYVGIFQLGSSERATWGHWPYSSSDPSTALTASAWDQIVAGHELYLDYGWQPWECARIVGIL